VRSVSLNGWNWPDVWYIVQFCVRLMLLSSIWGREVAFDIWLPICGKASRLSSSETYNTQETTTSRKLQQAGWTWYRQPRYNTQGGRDTDSQPTTSRVDVIDSQPTTSRVDVIQTANLQQAGWTWYRQPTYNKQGGCDTDSQPTTSRVDVIQRASHIFAGFNV